MKCNAIVTHAPTPLLYNFSNSAGIFISTPQTELADQIARRLCGKLGVHAGDELETTAAALADELRSIPEIAAIQELRDQFRSEKVQPAPHYPGRRSGIDPHAYLIEHYGAAIREGRLGPGQLFTLDASLYLSLQARLGSASPAQTVAEFFDSLTPIEKRGPRTVRRLHACSEILGSTAEEAAHFFGVMQPGRLGPAKRLDGGERNRS